MTPSSTPSPLSLDNTIPETPNNSTSINEQNEVSDKSRTWRKYHLRKALAEKTEKLTVSAQRMLPYQACSKVFGLIADCKIKPIKNWLIKRFVWMHKIDLNEAARKTPEEYESFNDFFTRKLDPDKREIAPHNKVASPVDGTISQIGTINDGKIIQAKNHSYTVEDLLGGDKNLAKTFKDGRFANIYLSPGDYHRFHMPTKGQLLHSTHVPGKLHSVSSKAARNIDNLFADNERVIGVFETDHGKMAMIMVGAINVSSIETHWDNGLVTPNKPSGKDPNMRTTQFNSDDSQYSYEAGDDVGTFRIGSTVICLYENDKVEWTKGLKSGSRVRMGSAIGSLTNADTAEE